MKRVVMEIIWVADDAFDEMSDTAEQELESMLDEAVLGVRVTLPGGNVVRAGVTFG